MSIQAIFSKTARIREQHVKKSVSDWMAAHSMNGEAPKVKESLTCLFTGIQIGSGKRFKKTVKTLGKIEMTKEQAHLSLLLAESLYLAGLYYPPKKGDGDAGKGSKPQKPHYFDKAISVCEGIISPGTDEASVKTAKTIIGRIMLHGGKVKDAKKLLEAAGTPVAFVTLAENARKYNDHLEAIQFYEKIPMGSLPEKLRVAILNNMAVSQLLYCYAEIKKAAAYKTECPPEAINNTETKKDAPSYKTEYLLEAINNMKEALKISNSDRSRTNLGSVCNSIVCILNMKKTLAPEERAAAMTAEIELAGVEGHFQKIRNDSKPHYTTTLKASWPAPIFMSVPESAIVDSIPAKAN